MGVRNRLAPFVRDGRTAVAAGVLALLLAVWGLVWFTSGRARSDAIASASAQLDQMAGAVAVALNRSLMETDTLLTGLPSLARNLAGSAAGERALSQVLRDLNDNNLFVRDLLIVAADGRPLATALPNSRRQALRPNWLGGEAGGLRLAGPLRNPSTQEWSIYLAREVEVMPGTRGLAVAEVAVDTLVTLFGTGGRAGVQQAGTPEMRLESSVGTILALAPHGEALIGDHAPAGETLAEALRARGTDVAVVRAADGRPALRALRPTVYPHIVAGISLDLEEALMAWREDRNVLLVGATAFSLLVLLAGSLILNGMASRAAAEQDGRRWRTMLENALESMSDGFVMYDKDDRLVVCNSRYRDFYRLSAPLLVPGARLEDIIREGALRGQYPQCGNDIDAFVAGVLAWHRGDNPPMERLLPDGRWLLVTERHTPDGGTVGIRTDISALKAAEAEARRRGEEDPLTGLPNRGVLRRELEAMATGAIEGGSLVLFDLDHFKAVNDSHGHPVGDRLLCELADRLRAVTRPGDTLARLGGDEYAVLLPGLRDAARVSDFLTRMKGALEQPVEADALVIRPSLSIGAACFPDDAADADGLMQAADMALYEAKRQGRGRWAFYHRGSAEAVLRRNLLAERVKPAIEEGRIEVVLQPKVRLSDGRVMGFEALARWRDDGELVPPSEFVAVAEDHGLGEALGWAIMRKALAAQRAMLDAGLEPGRVAVNLSSSQLLSRDLVEHLATELIRAKLGPERLELEITESVFLDRSATAASAALHAIAGLGVAVSLDDFGTGYASLSHLASMPVSQLKIDRRFVAELGSEGRGAVITRSIVGLARGLGIETVAEGVETAEQYALLLAEGCDVAQGYLISRPLSPEMATAWLRQARTHQAAPSLSTARLRLP